MSQPNPRTVGLFVVGALALVVAGLTAFGSRSYFEHRPRAVTFFHGSVAGLTVGAPVTFRGVRVGSVVDIAVQINSATGEANIPVIMEFEPERVTVLGGSQMNVFADKMLTKGLGASMVSQSLVTGQLSVELDYHDPSEETLTGIKIGLREIPEARGGLNAMKDTLSHLPLQEVVDNLLSALRSINELVSSPEVHSVITNLDKATKGLETTATTVAAQAGGLTQEAREAVDATRRTADHADALVTALQPQLTEAMTLLNRLLAGFDQRTGQITADLHTTLEGGDRTLAETQATMSDLHALLAPRSSSALDIQSLLHSLSAAAASIRSFSDQIDRNPNSLLMGKSSR